MGVEPRLARDAAGEAMPLLQQGAVTQLSISDAAAVTAGINGEAILLTTSVNCWYLIGENPTATTTTGTFLPAGGSFEWAIEQGEKVSAICDTGEAGFLNITVME